MNFRLPLSQWRQDLRYEVHRIIHMCDKESCFVHRANFGELASQLIPFLDALAGAVFVDRVTTDTEEEKFRDLLAQIKGIEDLILSYTKENFVKSVLRNAPDYVAKKISEFRDKFNSLVLELALANSKPIKYDSRYGEINNIEDINEVIQVIEQMINSGGLRISEKERLRHKIYEYNKLRARCQSSDPVLPNNEIEQRLAPFSSWIVPEEDFDCEDLIGKGGFSDVSIGYQKSAKKSVALKRLNSTVFTNATMEMLERELRILSRIKHPCILSFVGVCLSPSILIITEYMSGGSLYDRLHDEKYQMNPLTPTEKTIIAMGIAHGMAHLHSRRVIHRDLKSLNVLLDNNMYPRIGDFGISRSTTSSSGVMTRGAGTSQWMAPEVISSDKYDEKADVYSYGILLWELVTHRIPYDSSRNDGEWDCKEVASKDLRPIIPPSCPPELASLMTECWYKDPTQRPTFSTIKMLFDEDRVAFADSKRSDVEVYMDWLAQAEPADDVIDIYTVLDECEDAEEVIGKYGEDLVTQLMIKAIEECSTNDDYTRLTMVIGEIVLNNELLMSLFLAKNGLELLIETTINKNLRSTPHSVGIWTKAMDICGIKDKILNYVNNELQTMEYDVFDATLDFIASLNTSKINVSRMILNLLSCTHKYTNNDEFMTKMISLLNTWSKYEGLFFEINKQIGGLLECDISKCSVEIQTKILDFLGKCVSEFPASQDLCDTFCRQLPALLQVKSQHERVVFIATQLANNRNTRSCLTVHHIAPLLEYEPKVVVQALKIIYLLLQKETSVSRELQNRIQRLLDHSDDNVVRMAVICLLTVPNFANCVDESLLPYMRRALTAENSLTYDCLRLCGILCQTKTGYALVHNCERNIASCLKSQNSSIVLVAVSVLTCLSLVDQLSRVLIDVTEEVAGLLDDEKIGPTALSFISNMTQNYEAALNAAPHFPTLVKLLQSGNMRALAPIYRIATLYESCDSCKSSLRDLVKLLEPFIKTEYSNVVCEIFDTIVQWEEGKAALSNSQVPEILGNLVTEMKISDPSKRIVMRLIGRLR